MGVQHGLTAFTRGRVVPVDGPAMDGATVLVRDGLIEAVGTVDVPADATVVDCAGQWVLPGFVDAHVHLGLHEEGEGSDGNDTNEMTDPVTAHVRALDAVYPGDLGFRDALAGGVTAVNVNPGSGNPIGGQTVALRCWGRTVEEMLLRAPSGVKSALGENPKRVYGSKNRTPATRLGTAAVIRAAFAKAADYDRKAGLAEESKRPDRDLGLEALAMVLRREIPWRQHCHRADDIATALRLADEFGYDLVIDHGTEAHLLADVIAERGIPVLIGPLMTSRSKVELRQRSMRNPGLLAAAGVEISIITDHPVVPINFLVLQATLAVKEGLSADVALRALTLHPAKVMGVVDRLGSLTPGKGADLVLWSGDPLDARSRALSTWIEGREVYRYDPSR